MKLSFSTLGCPEWSYEEIFSAASDLGYDAVELRCINVELLDSPASPFNEDKVSKTMSDLRRSGLEISCITTSYTLYLEKTEKDIELAIRYINLAGKMKTPFIRLLADGKVEPFEAVDDRLVLENLKSLLQAAFQNNVKLLVETNGAFAESQRLKNLIESAESEMVGVLWDVHHPYRYFNETVSKTYSTLKDYISYVHIKDSIIVNGNVVYKIPGKGDVPLSDVIYLLKKGGYDGYLSLEWVKKWNVELEEPGIVFPAFPVIINRYLQEN